MRYVSYRHPRLGFRLRLPADWERLEDTQLGVPLIAAEPQGGNGRFRANVVVTVEELPGHLDLDDWQESAETMLPSLLQDYLLLDRERLSLHGHDVVRRLAHHAQEGPTAVTMQQWSTVRGSLGYTLSATSGTMTYPELAEAFGSIAEGFEVPS